jgi:hypothetical protein
LVSTAAVCAKAPVAQKKQTKERAKIVIFIRLIFIG